MTLEEKEIVNYFNDGASAPEIAQELGLSLDHVEDVIDKYEQKLLNTYE
jgi:predicted DNA-binding protein YlxM (UPF0122 family)